MVASLGRLALALSLFGSTFAAIPQQEKDDLAKIVEDEVPASAQRKGGDDKWVSPVYSPLFQKALPIPPVKKPKYTIKNPVTGKDILFFQVDIKPFEQQVYPGKKPARLVGYDGIAPGPTFIIPQGVESIVRFVNHAEKPNSVHLHGSPSRGPFDGWAEDVTKPGEYKDYYYPNYESARMLWYHDHAVHITAENAHFGQAGVYLVDDARENALGLPSGYGEFDIPLVLGAKYYNQDGTLKSTEGELESVWGDVIHVNGQPWPFLNVQPRKYRFRFLDAAVSRSFALYFTNAKDVKADVSILKDELPKKIPFQVIASDAGLLERPVKTDLLYLSIAERYEVVVDFTNFKGQTIELRNIAEVNDQGVEDEYAETDRVMQFKVSNDAVADPSRVPEILRNIPAFPVKDEPDHHFKFHRSNGEWQINGHVFSDVNNRILAKPPRGTVEVWELENSSGGWTHPIHIHLVDFKVLSRSGGDKRGVEPYEAAGLKDVVWLARGETVKVEARYGPWDDVYMFHCHNLIHEDHDMMAAFNVTQLKDFGYNETTIFNDPLDPRWRARPYEQADFAAQSGPFSEEAIKALVEELARQQPYSELEEVEAAIEKANPQKLKREIAAPAVGPIPRYRRFVL